MLLVTSIEGERVKVNVEQGGGMRDHIGVHLPSKTMRISALTEKDKEDLIFGLSSGVDYIALSFVRRADDIKLVREITNEWGQPTPIIAKIETPDAIENLESIVAASDGVMVARGDLGVEFPPERVPVIQRQILGVARRVRRPVIVATEMLQSMTTSTRPTRAEASDVANAVYSGTDAVMLSGETANGQHPILAAAMMSRIAMEAEASPFFESQPYASRATSIAEAIARGAVNAAREIGARYLVAFTESGSSATNVSLARPQRTHHRLLAEPEDAPPHGAALGRHPARGAGGARRRRAGRLLLRRPHGGRPRLPGGARRHRLRRPVRRQRQHEHRSGARPGLN